LEYIILKSHLSNKNIYF